jgi:NhaP-type Na+/H+ and K+/H+ antiporter
VNTKDDDNNHLTLYVLKQKRKHHAKKKDWQTVSLFNETNNFLGPAVFETEKDAQEYMKIYKSRLINWNEQNQSNNYVSKTGVQLKIFK